MISILLASIAKLGLFLGHMNTYAAVVLVGLFTRYRNIIARALCLLLFTIVYNVYLKSIWKVPLPEPLVGWAFPSGHMHSAVVFWGWLAWEMRTRWAFIAATVIYILVGYALVYYGYHYPTDILGSLAFGCTSIVIYGLLNRIKIFKEQPYYLALLLTALALFIAIVLLPPAGRKPHMWHALTILLGFSFGWLMSNPRSRIVLGKAASK